MSHLTPAQRDKISANAIEQGLTPFYWKTGVTIDRKDRKGMTIQQALAAADLDFTVSKAEGGMFVKPDASAPPRFIKSGQHYYTYRDDTLDIFGAVKSRYQILQNREAFTFASDIVDSGEAPISAVGSEKGGARTFVVCDLLGTGMTVEGIEEGVTPKLVLINDHRGNEAVTGFITMERIWCHNLLNYALKNAVSTFKVRHTATMHDKLAIQTGREALGLVVEYSAEFEKAMAKLLKAKMGVKAIENFVETLVPYPVDADGEIRFEDKSGKSNRAITVADKVREGIIEVYNTADNLNNIRGTAYGMLNAVSEYYQHHTEGRNTRADGADAEAVEKVKAENRFNRLMSGQGLDHKAWALLEEQFLTPA